VTERDPRDAREPTPSLAGKTLFITGASRGIGKAIALRAARDGANVAVIGKTDRPHAKLDGTVHTAAAEIEAAGGRALACVCDIRSTDDVQAAIDATVARFGGIDVLVNNASAIYLATTDQLDMKRFDLMHAVCARGTFLCSKLCLLHLERAANPHILVLAPPLRLEPSWFGRHLGYTLAKFGMSLCVLGLAQELADKGIAVNALWPKTTIATAAIANLFGGEQGLLHSRKPEIVADAAHVVLSKPSREFTGQFCIDEDVLAEAGVSDFERYACEPGAELFPDLFV
jgi:citronellol/citronellal dehydrogenase